MIEYLDNRITSVVEVTFDRILKGIGKINHPVGFKGFLRASINTDKTGAIYFILFLDKNRLTKGTTFTQSGPISSFLILISRLHG